MTVRSIAALLVIGMSISAGATHMIDRAGRDELDRELVRLRELRDEVCWVKAPEYVKTACAIYRRDAN